MLWKNSNSNIKEIRFCSTNSIFGSESSFNTALSPGAVDEALECGSPAAIDSEQRKTLLSGSEVLSPSHTHMFNLSLPEIAARNCPSLTITSAKRGFRDYL